jgi:tetratricopeptide (TPR) repeat protein
MTNRIIAILAAGLFAATSVSFAQKLKSQKEQDAVMAIQNAADANARLAAIENLLTKFADTEFKPIVLEMAIDAARSKNDSDQTILYCERLLEADGGSLSGLSTLAKVIADTTRENDLDKEEKLKRATELANKAISSAPNAKNPAPALIPAEQWTVRAKDLASMAHEALAAVAMVRKKHEDAIAEYKLALDTPNPDPATMIRLGMVYSQLRRHDEALAILDKAIASTDNPQIKQIAGQEKVKVATAKAAEKK